MTISSATTAAPLLLVPPAPDAATERGLYAANTTLATVPPAGDAGAGAAAIGGGDASQQLLVDTLRQALAVLTQLVAQLSGGATTGGGAIGQTPGQMPAQVPMQVPTQTPIQAPPMKVPMQVPTQGGGPTDAVGGGEVGGVALSEGPHAVTLEDDNGDSVRIWGDPHVDVKLDGRREKFDIGYGPGEITLQDGTHVSWDTGRGNILSTLSIDRPQGVDGDVSADVNDRTKLKDEATGLTNAQLREFIGELRQFEGKPHEPLKRAGVEGGGGPAKR